MTITNILPFNNEAIAEAARLILGGQLRRRADRDGLRPRRRRHERRGRRPDLRGQGPAVVQSAHRSRPLTSPQRREIGEFDEEAHGWRSALARSADPGGAAPRSASAIASLVTRRSADHRASRPRASRDAGAAARRPDGRSPRRRPMPAARSARPAPSMSSRASAAGIRADRRWRATERGIESTIVARDRRAAALTSAGPNRLDCGDGAGEIGSKPPASLRATTRRRSRCG